MDYRKYLVDRTRLDKVKQQLLSVATLTDEDIMDIWIEEGQKRMTDFTLIEFPHPMCLYKHMILRFHMFEVPGFSLDPAVFIKGLNPTSQDQLASHYKMYDRLVFEFFSYIRNGIELINELGLSVENWKSKSSIIFYFEASKDVQQKMIDKYNHTYDELIKEQDDMRRANSNYTTDVKSDDDSCSDDDSD